jgi:hypothetical protein
MVARRKMKGMWCALRMRWRKSRSDAAQAKVRHRSPAVRQTHSRASESPYPAVARSRFVTRHAAEACRPRVRLRVPSR